MSVLREVSLWFLAAIIPDSVDNLKVQVDSNIPSATLTWDPPCNCIVGTQSTCTDVSSYHIRFKQERQHYNDVYVNGAKTSVVFSEELGLSLNATFTFEVRAQSGDNFGEWKAVSVFIGELHKGSWLTTVLQTWQCKWNKWKGIMFNFYLGLLQIYSRMFTNNW